MIHEAETKSPKRPTQNLGPVDAELHRLLKAHAANADKSLRRVLEEALAPIVGWSPPGQLVLNGVAE